VTVEYRIEHGACIPLRVHTVVISVQHSEDISLEDMRKELMDKVVKVRRRRKGGEGEERV
jgi:S-adenosylmethionine synthetase